MRIGLAISCVAMTSFLLPAAFPGIGAAQVNVQVQIGVPTIRFETAPVLVEVSPGIQVVPEYEHEVFFVDGWYWHRTGRTWYHTRDHRGGWAMVHRREVPRGLTHFPPGRYKHYRAEGPRMNGPRREIPPGHRGEARFQKPGADNGRAHFERKHGERQERREPKGRGEGHREGHGGHR
jgi:hypothetical protein